MEIGVLALQGGFRAHAEALGRLGHEARLIRYPDQLHGLEGLVLPGGESSTQLELIRRVELAESLDAMVSSGRPVLATCAGLVLAAREVFEPRQNRLVRPVVATTGLTRQSSAQAVASDRGLVGLAQELDSDLEKASRCRNLGWIDVAVTRNGWGRQLDSFEAESDRSGLPLVFIRAPRITAIGPRVEVLETLNEEPILVRQGSFVGATFHPELTDDRTVASIAFGG